MLKPVGLLLAGGEGRRLGGADKAFLIVAGRPLIAHAMSRFALQSSEPLISANGDLSRFTSFGGPVVADETANRLGPLAGLLAGLDWVARQRLAATHVLTLPADTPFPPPDLCARLEQALRNTGATIAVATSGDRTHHAIALWPVSIRTALRAALQDDERAVNRFSARFPTVMVEWPTDPYDPFFNVNTSDDLVQAEAIAQKLSAS